MTSLICIFFASRAIRDFVAAAGIGILAFGQPWEMAPWQSALYFVLYFCWEIVPIASVMLLFWHIPRTAVHRWRDDKYSEANVNLSVDDYTSVGSNEGESLLSKKSGSGLFDNPQRYDSDEDDGLMGADRYRFAIQDYSAYTPDVKSSWGSFERYKTPYNTSSPLTKEKYKE